MPASAESTSAVQEDRKKPAAAPQRPPLRSNFDLEPNPFEQSFSSTRAPSDVSSSSVSSTNNRSLKQNDASAASPPSKLNGETPKPMLPPLASIASPSGDSYAWGMSATDLGSLRSGPLSPAMLAGPQNTSGVAGSSASLALAFDASGFGRTGLTPSTGLTPLVAGPVSFPPPSPNTAAFLAMVSNSTTAATLAAGTAATITPNTLSAITGVLNHTAIPQSYSTYAPRSDTAYSAANGSTSDGQAQVNGLFLLSQAHQELAKREEAQRASSAVPSDVAPMNGTTTNAAPRRAPKRKTTEPPAPVAAPAAPARNPSKKPRAAASAAKSKRGKRAESTSDEDDDGLDSDTMNDMTGANQSANNKNKKPETEEEKRRNFLERNRQAALKCRQRKKAWLAQLQAKVEFLTTENERLNAALLKSSEEINRLTALVNAQTVVAAPPGSVQATVVGAGGRGFGY